MADLPQKDLMSGERPYLDLNPHYQRNVVWTRKAKQMLIDSMFEGFFIPPVRLTTVDVIDLFTDKDQVIFNVTKVIDENGLQKFKRTCVDGKQVEAHLALQQSSILMQSIAFIVSP